MNALNYHQQQQKLAEQQRLTILNPPPGVAERICLYRWYNALPAEEQRRIREAKSHG